MRVFKQALLSASAASVLLTAGVASAQDANAGTPYVMADGTRTADYEAALQSWRDDTQFAVDYSKGYLGLEHAYAQGLTGAGVTVAINDSGVYWDHPLFAGRANGLDTGASDELGNNGSISSTEPWHTHGTHVAGTAVGRRIAGQSMFGNAFGANIYSATIHFASQNLAYGTEILNGNPVSDGIDNILNIAQGNHARIINNSWGYNNETVRHDASLEDINEYFEGFSFVYDTDWSDVISNDIMLIVSAGNDGEYHASAVSMLPRYVPELDGNVISVTNYSSQDTHTRSSLCGDAATWCVSGPGTNIISSVPDYNFNNESWEELYNINTLIDDDRFMDIYEESDGIIEAIELTYKAIIEEFITERTNSTSNGTPFDIEERLQELALNGSEFVKRTSALFDRPGDVFAFGSEYFYENLIDNIGENLSSEEALIVANLFKNDLHQAFEQYSGNLTSGYSSESGTSMAGPNIAGFAALLIEKFPEYNTALITDILLSSGRDIEEEGVDIRAGWGVPQMGDALNGPQALRAIREVRVAGGTRDIWSNDITNAIDKYSPLVLERNPNDIGGLTKVGGGELVLTGTSTYSGATRVLEGLLTLDGQLTRSALSVANLGIIGGTGTLASLTAEAGGVVAPGNSANPFGTLNVSGDARFLPGSFLWVRSNVNASEYSKLAVTGATTLEGGSVIVKADTGAWNIRNRNLRILTSEGGVTGQFEGATSDLGFLTPTLTYQPNSVLMQLVRNDVPIASAGTTPNETATGAALDIMTARNTSGNLTLEDAILDGSFEAVSASLRYLTGEVHASLAGLTARNAAYVRDAMLDRGRTQPGTTSIEQPVQPGVTAWASGQFGNGNYDGNDEYNRYQHESSGFAFGLDKTFEGGALVGIAAGQSRSKLDINPLNSNGKSTTTQVGLYAGTTMRGLGLRVGGTWIDAEQDTRRTVRLNALNESLLGEYEGDGWQAYAEASFAFQTGRFAIEPYVNYTRYDYEADVVETGGDTALGGQISHKADLLTGGLRANALLAGSPGRPSVRAVAHLAYTENLDDEGLLYRARFADGPDFNIRGAQPLDGAVTTNLGINIRATERLSFDVGYSGLHQSDFNDNRAYGRISLSF